MEFQWTVSARSTARFELSQLPDELILKLGTISSKVWTRLAFSVPFVGKWSLDGRTLARIRRETPLPKIECWHHYHQTYRPEIRVCSCGVNACCHISTALAAFLCVHPDSKIQRRRVVNAISEYIRINKLISCVAVPLTIDGTKCRELVKIDARLGPILYHGGNEVCETDNIEALIRRHMLVLHDSINNQYWV
jgi:hypothetical protein